jgi:hypothetical protein
LGAASRFGAHFRGGVVVEGRSSVGAFGELHAGRIRGSLAMYDRMIFKVT